MPKSWTSVALPGATSRNSFALAPGDPYRFGHPDPFTGARLDPASFDEVIVHVFGVGLAVEAHEARSFRERPAPSYS